MMKLIAHTDTEREWEIHIHSLRGASRDTSSRGAGFLSFFDHWHQGNSALFMAMLKHELVSAGHTGRFLLAGVLSEAYWGTSVQ